MSLPVEELARTAVRLLAGLIKGDAAVGHDAGPDAQGSRNHRTGPGVGPRAVALAESHRPAVESMHDDPDLSNRFERPCPSASGMARPEACAPLLAAACLLALAACGSATAGGGSDVDTLTEIDYYDAAPQNTQLPKLLDECGDAGGVTIEHQQVPRAQFMPKLLQQASARSLPDLALVDNPDLQQLAATGGLVPLSEAGSEHRGAVPVDRGGRAVPGPDVRHRARRQRPGAVLQHGPVHRRPG